MLEKKNVVEKFNKFVSKLSQKEMRQLYDLLCMMRGPDSHYYNLKNAFTARIRYLLGFNGASFTPGLVNTTEFPKKKFILKILEDHKENQTLNHYVAHANFMIKILVDLGIIKE